jgi:hypothetical protein
VGPVQVGGAALSAVTIAVLPPIADNVSDPEEMARLLAEAGRASSFILGESDQSEAWVGQPIILTWSLYTQEVVSDLDVASMPTLADFWTEELPVVQEPTSDVLVGDRRMRKIPIRRVALFPLRAGQLKVGSLVTTASVMRPIGRRSNPFSFLNQEIETTTLRSPSRTFAVRALPGGPHQGVGVFTMSCGSLKAATEGPVSVEVLVEGAGNLRAAAPPRFAAPPAARIEIVDGGVTVNRQSEALSMRRSWTFLLFPTKTGELVVPELLFRAFDPKRAESTTLRCGGGAVLVRTVPASKATPLPEGRPIQPDRPARWPWVLRAVAAAVALAVALRMRRRRVPKWEVERVLQHFEHPRAMRTELYEVVAERGLSAESLLRESSERGDTFRAVQSLIDIAEKETLTGNVSRRELRRRMAEFLRAL